MEKMKRFIIEFGELEEDGFGCFFFAEAVDCIAAIDNFREAFPNATDVRYIEEIGRPKG
jgi:hypothetical protein